MSYNNSPAWSPDGPQLVAFHQTRTRSDGAPVTGVYQKASSGKAEFLMGGGFTIGDWSADGQYLAGYRGTRDVFDVWVMPLTGDRKPFALMTTPLTGQGRFEAGVPRALFPTSLSNMPPGQRHFAVSNDGQRFLINAVQPRANQRQITVVVNWPVASLQTR